MNTIKFGSARFLLFLWCCITTLSAHRSIHRPPDPHIPEIITFWTDEKTGTTIPSHHFILRSYYLTEWSVFGRYNQELLEQNQLPEHISYHYEPAQSVPQHILTELIEDLIQELLQATKKRESFKNFTILKDRNFSYSMHAGLIIVKFKQYPFVVKLFIEDPKSFTRPNARGLEEEIFFLMGCRRYTAGFTRIPNLLSIREKTAADPYWAERLVLPRKWYWTPKNGRTFTVIGTNMGSTGEQQEKEFPSIYAIICDEIQLEHQLHTYHKRDRAIVKEIVQFLGNRIDPHVYNFFIEKGTGKIAIIDTEHLASLVGLEKPIEFHNNTQWYCSLTEVCLRKALFRTKKHHRRVQKQPLSDNLTL